ncbi:hypothetical protein IB286_13190 [Spongiibacter sp. KMU-158]|uniref:Uncharacterized protein n=1 Tax=Spongiibacter pelagi TaxID=2760804 RepID=A0A927C4E2_9GAMM|nr:hypothetical protein [Spongiibacter pelagi]MBD2859958.1 hypothetical protein [Spongiibacter pelagi]
MTKRFGKCSAEDLKGLLVFQHESIQMETEMAATLSGKLDTEMPRPFSWLKIYNSTFFELVSICVSLFNLESKVIEFANSGDPQKALSDWGASDETIPEVGESARPYALAALQAIFRTFKSIRYYGYSLDTFVSSYSKTSDDKILFKMLRVDKSLLAHPNLERRIAIAEAEGDAGFFKKLASAINGQPSQKLLEYPELRLCLVALHQEDALESLNEEKAYQLFCVDLAIYPHDGDAARSLWKFIERWKKNYPT